MGAPFWAMDGTDTGIIESGFGQQGDMTAPGGPHHQAGVGLVGVGHIRGHAEAVAQAGAGLGQHRVTGARLRAPGRWR